MVARNLPFTGMHFPIFEAVKARLIKWRAGKTNGGYGESGAMGIMLERAGITTVSAGVAGSIAAVVTTPIDVVKTRIMLSAGDGEDTGKKNPGPVSLSRRIKEGSRSIWVIGIELYQKEGLRGLFSGGALRACWTAVGLGLYLGTYEGGRFYLENRRKEKEHAGRLLDREAII